jgi:cytochrome P450
MRLYPEVQKRAHGELDSVLQGKRLPELGDQDSLPYITAIAKEATRWHPVLPTGSSHCVQINSILKLMDVKGSHTCPLKTMSIMVILSQRGQSLLAVSGMTFISVILNTEVDKRPRAILHDPEAYEDPMRFMPERFIKDGRLNPDVRDPSVAAFGFGRRICPGMHMSDISLFLTIASTLAVYDIQTELDEEGKPVQMSGEYVTGSFQ